MNAVFRAKLTAAKGLDATLRVSSGNPSWSLPLFKNGLTSLSNDVTLHYVMFKRPGWELFCLCHQVLLSFHIIIGIPSTAGELGSNSKTLKHATGLFTALWKIKGISLTTEVEKVNLLRFWRRKGKEESRCPLPKCCFCFTTCVKSHHDLLFFPYVLIHI